MLCEAWELVESKKARDRCGRGGVELCYRAYHYELSSFVLLVCRVDIFVLLAVDELLAVNVGISYSQVYVKRSC